MLQRCIIFLASLDEGEEVTLKNEFIPCQVRASRFWHSNPRPHSFSASSSSSSSSSSFCKLVGTVDTSGLGAQIKSQLKSSNLAPEAYGALQLSLGTHGPEHMPERMS